MKAAERREVADRFAELAVDRMEVFSSGLACDVFPEELLEMQHDLEELFYRELAQVRA